MYQFGIFSGITNTIPKENSVSIFGIKKLAGAPQKIGGSPLFPKKGGIGPLFVYFALLLEKKRNSRGIFQKKSSHENLKMCSRQSLQY